MSGKKRILVCGGGNGAHCLAALASANDRLEVHVLTLFADEAERWSNSLVEDHLKISITYNDGTEEDKQTKPLLITKDPESAMEGISVIFFTVPAFAHGQYLTELKPFIKDNDLLVGLPGQAGFEFQCRSILGDKTKNCVLVSFESLPWACRILEFGKHVQILGFKETLGGSELVGSNTKIDYVSVDVIQSVLGEKPEIKLVPNYIAVTLMAKSIIHPPILYGKWREFDGNTLKERPLFYQGVDDEQADLLSSVSDEVVQTAKKIQELRPEADMSSVIHIFDWYKEYYRDQISDQSSLKMAMITNKAYDGLLHPMKGGPEGGYVPDFSYRYMREDVPYGLVVMKGIADIVEVATPTIDKIIEWAQVKLNQEYISDEKLTGADISKTRAPQAYGFSTVDDLFNF